MSVVSQRRFWNSSVFCSLIPGLCLAVTVVGMTMPAHAQDPDVVEIIYNDDPGQDNAQEQFDLFNEDGSNKTVSFSHNFLNQSSNGTLTDLENTDPNTLIIMPIVDPVIDFDIVITNNTTILRTVAGESVNISTVAGEQWTTFTFSLGQAFLPDGTLAQGQPYFVPGTFRSIGTTNSEHPQFLKTFSNFSLTDNGTTLTFLNPVTPAPITTFDTSNLFGDSGTGNTPTTINQGDMVRFQFSIFAPEANGKFATRLNQINPVPEPGLTAFGVIAMAGLGACAFRARRRQSLSTGRN